MIWQMCIEKAKSIELQPSGWQANSQASRQPGSSYLLAFTCYQLPST